MKLRKSITVIATLIIIAVAGFSAYYFINLNKGPYASSDLASVSYKWGVGDTLINSYNSATGDYQYLDSRDSLIKIKLKLRANNIIFLHSKANEAGLWKLPGVIANPNANLKSDKVLRYEIVFNYEQKAKKIIFMTDYVQDQVIANSVAKIQAAIEQTLKEREGN
jgi:hypothetical protein